MFTHTFMTSAPNDIIIDVNTVKTFTLRDSLRQSLRNSTSIVMSTFNAYVNVYVKVYVKVYVNNVNNVKMFTSIASITSSGLRQ